MCAVSAPVVSARQTPGRPAGPGRRARLASGVRLLSVDSGTCRLVLFPVAGDRAEG